MSAKLSDSLFCGFHILSVLWLPQIISLFAHVAVRIIISNENFDLYFLQHNLYHKSLCRYDIYTSLINLIPPYYIYPSPKIFQNLNYQKCCQKIFSFGFMCFIVFSPLDIILTTWSKKFQWTKIALCFQGVLWVFVCSVDALFHALCDHSVF